MVICSFKRGAFNNFNNKKGFTLTELVIVIAILAILAAIAVPLVTNAVESAKNSTDATNLKTLNVSTEIYSINKGVAQGEDIFEGISTDAQRMQILVDNKLLKTALTPQQSNKIFQWNVAVQQWKLMTVDNVTSLPTTAPTPLPVATPTPGPTSSPAPTTPAPTPTPTPVSNYAAWENKVYAPNTFVTYGGKVFYNRTDSSINVPPGTLYSAWQEVTDQWRNYNVYNTGDTALYNGIKYRAKWYTSNQAPGDIYGPWEQVN